jgi:hypothetical protein
VGEITQGPKKRENYNIALKLCRKHPGRESLQAIRSLRSAGGLQQLGGATPIPAGDETTWLDGGLKCRFATEVDPLKKEEEAHAGSDEHGVAFLEATGSTGRTTPPRLTRREEPNLQKL